MILNCWVRIELNWIEWEVNGESRSEYKRLDLEGKSREEIC